MATLQTFQDLRLRLMAIAYRMLGSFAEAEDALQDAWLRWQEADETGIRDPAAWQDRAALSNLTATALAEKPSVRLLVALGERLWAEGGDAVEL